MLTFLHNLSLGIWRTGSFWRFPKEVLQVRMVHGMLWVTTKNRMYYSPDGHRWYRI